jgi:PEGA domain
MLRPLILVALVLLPACASRRVDITSEPPGALVFLNDTEIGTTPCSAEFRFYGSYDVRLEKTGFEPLRTRADASAPIYEYPPLDLAAEASPIPVSTTIRWHFTLTPSLEKTQSEADLEQGLIERAKEMGKRLEPTR